MGAEQPYVDGGCFLSAQAGGYIAASCAPVINPTAWLLCPGAGM